MRDSRLLAALALGASVYARPAGAFVSTPVGGHPGELDVSAVATAERGKTEPNENEASWRPTRGWYEATFGAGYTFGHLGPLQFFALRLQVTHFTTPAERNDPAAWPLAAPGSSAPGAPQPECGGGARYLGGGLCEFYPADRGTLATGEVAFAIFHDPRMALGLFLRATVPFAMDLEKFENPRVDYFAGGFVFGAELQPWLAIEASTYLGSGTRPFGTQQNGALALGTLFHARTRSWILPWRAGVKLGPYVEGDLHEREDARYDLAFSPVVTRPGVSAEVATDRVRAARFAVATLPYFLVTEHVSVELGYVQKLFGYDARATQVWFAGVRGLVELSPPGR
ncbi:MAG: hypothetical protein IT376_01175 [Polyangiaceae bacterium]|nr:hypothetical protein [Polyangiaceae bacterium]